jgi:hypothetical protein
MRQQGLCGRVRKRFQVRTTDSDQGIRGLGITGSAVIGSCLWSFSGRRDGGCDKNAGSKPAKNQCCFHLAWDERCDPELWPFMFLTLLPIWPTASHDTARGLDLQRFLEVDCFAPHPSLSQNDPCEIEI